MFTILMLACCGYACIAGGKEGRITTLLLFSAGLSTLAVTHMGARWSGMNIPVLIVDIGLLIGLGFIAARTFCFWPIWFFGLHLATIATHIVTIFLPSWNPDLYEALEASWSIPELAIMTFGIMLDRQARKNGNFTPIL